MRRLIYLLCALAIVSFSLAGPLFFGLGGSIVATSGGGGGGVTLFFSEYFEGTGYDGGSWTSEGPGAGGENPDYTTSPLEGSQSLRIAASDVINVVSPSFTAKTEVWGKLRVKCANETSAPRWIIQDASTPANLAEFRINNVGSGPQWQVLNNGGSTTLGSAVTLGTTYYVWFHWAKGTGANSVTELFVSTSNAKPGSADVSITTGAAATDATRLYFRDGGGSDIVFDALELSAIGFPTP